MGLLIFHILIFIALSSPLLAAIIFSVKKIHKSSINRFRLKTIIAIILFLIIIFASGLLITSLFCRFILNSFLPAPYHAISSGLFFLYYVALFPFLGIANSFIGMSPTKIIEGTSEIINYQTKK